WSDFLAFSGEYTYRLEMRRYDLKVDASEDFLCNVKQGFCEHFATGLALMLRSAGIPARVVNGFRGAESQGDDEGRAGYYTIRQSHAHSWVEALLPRPGPKGEPGFYWLTLDPTPSSEAQTRAGWSWTQWWERSRHLVQDLWKGMILDYNLDKQRDTGLALWNQVAPPERLAEVARWFRQEEVSDPVAPLRGPWLPPLPALMVG